MDPQIEKARELKAQGWSLRKIAVEVGLPLTQLFRKLQATSPSPTLEVGDSHALQGSARVIARIAETRAHIEEIDAELEELPALKESILAAESFDGDALAALEEREAQLRKDRNNREKRLILLAQQQETEESKESQQRLHEIVAAAERLQEQEAPLLAEYESALKILVERAQAIAALHVQHRELGFEEVYLVERYRLPRLAMPQLSEHPQTGKATTALAQAYAPLQYSGQTVWERKRRQWHAQRSTQPTIARSATQ